MKQLFFDAGPVITLVMSRLGWTLPLLQKQFGGTFYITPAVKYELVDRPLATKRFELEAFEVMKLLREGVFEVYEKVPQKKCLALKILANSTFTIDNKPMDIMQAGEMESVTAALEVGGAVVMDERTLRLFIENNLEMKHLLEIRFKRHVEADKSKMNEFSQQLREITIIRSIELIGVAYWLGFLESYVPKLRNGRATLVDALLWAAKTNGCAVTEREIEELKQALLP